MKQITPQQKIFVLEYIKTLDGVVAAKNAGYKSKNLNYFSEKLLKDSDIVHEIQRELDLEIKTLKVEKGYVIQKLLQVAEFSLQEEDILDKEGNLTGKTKLRDTSAGLKALENLSKYIGLTKPKDEPDSTLKIITIENLDNNKI